MPELDDTAMTLDPPGTIAVVGAGPTGIEAALYGRFLGYDVTLIEAESVCHSLHDRHEQPLPMLPDRCLSPLAVSALRAQLAEAESNVLPMTYGQWVEQAWIPLTESDLLAGRLQSPARVVAVTTVPIEPDDADSDETSDNSIDEIPEDFRLRLDDGQSIDAEAVVLAIGPAPAIPVDFETPIPYFFRVGQQASDDAEHDLRLARTEIVELFAKLAGRSDLDLYRPRRG
jgi:hypothetical protein